MVRNFYHRVFIIIIIIIITIIIIIIIIIICKFYLVRGSVSSTQEQLQFYHPLHQQLPPYT